MAHDELWEIKQLLTWLELSAMITQDRQRRRGRQHYFIHFANGDGRERGQATSYMWGGQTENTVKVEKAV